jgi:hypothetical protein
MIARTPRPATLALWACLAMAASPSARAQDVPAIDPTSPLAQEIVSCMAVEDDAKRLDCFDAVAAPLAQGDAGADAAVFNALRGEDDWDSEAFTIDQPWHLAWSLEGSLLTVELRDPQDELHSVVANQIGAGEGVSPGLEAGTWKLAIRAVGAWQVRLVRGAAD